MADGETLNFPVLLWHPDGQRVAVDGQALPVLSAGTATSARP